jgi:hypothetical protein
VSNEWCEAQRQNTDPVGECDALVLDLKRTDFVVYHFAMEIKVTTRTAKMRSNRGGARRV